MSSSDENKKHYYRWINSSDLLPVEYEWVIGYDEHKGVGICFFHSWHHPGEYRKHAWVWLNAGRTSCHITHWTPMLEPPNSSSITADNVYIINKKGDILS